MKKIVCELCDGTEFTKDGGMFVCNGCGTKYTAEEAKGMMQEVEGDAPAPVVSAPAGNPNQQQLENILMLASSAYEADNKEEAENYCNQAIVLDAMCYRAWFLKGKAVGWQSKIDHLRIEEAAHSFCKAIDFAPEEEKDSIKEQAVEEIRKLGIALITLRKNRFSKDPSDSETKGFSSDRVTVLEALMILLRHGNLVSIPDGYNEEVASLMNQAGVAALNMVRKAWKSLDHPSEKDFDTYLNWNCNISTIFREAIEASDEDDEADIVRYKNLKISLGEPMDVGACSYKREWSDWQREYVWVKEYSLADSAVQNRKKEMKECDEKIAALKKKKQDAEKAEKRKAEEEKQKRIDAYWAAHKEEKEKLEAEKKELIGKRLNLDAEKDRLTKELNSAEAEGKGSVPSEEEEARLTEQKRQLEEQRAACGLFAGKEKKRLGEEIAAIEGRLMAVKDKIKAEKDAKKAEAQKKAAPIREKIDANNTEYAKVTKRIAAIDAELTKDPEE